MRFGQGFRRLAFAAAASTLLAGPGLSQTLTIGVPGGPQSLDPHVSAAGPVQAGALRHVFDTLVGSGDRLQLEPGLALSWKALDPNIWEFKLRPGVKFHDGSDFTAEDVKVSIERLASVSAPGSSALRRIKETRIVDPNTVQLVTDGPAPTLPKDLARLFIVARKALEGLSSDTAGEAFNSGKAAIGTGPFRVLSFAPKQELVLERFDAHWRGAPAWQKVTVKVVPDDAARIAELKAGRFDLIARVPIADAAALERDPKLKLVRAETPKIFRLEFDFRDKPAQVAAKDGSALPQNPLKDARVREAIDLAIDRPALAEVSMEGFGKPANQIVPPGALGYDDKLAELKPNLERARQLLGEAGYPDGFKVGLAYPADRWPGDRAVGMSVARMLSRTGLEVQASRQPAAAFFTVRGRGDYPLVIAAPETVSDSEEALAALGHGKAADGSPGAANWGGYSNLDLDKLLDEAAAELDEGKRKKLLEDAAALFGRERVALPLVAVVSVWAMQKDKADLPKPRADEETLASDVVPVGK